MATALLLHAEPAAAAPRRRAADARPPAGITLPFRWSGTATPAIAAPSSARTCGTAPVAHFTYSARRSGVVEVDTAGSSWDTTVAVLVATASGLRELACNDDTPGGRTQARLRFAAVAGVRYVVVVSGHEDPPLPHLVLTARRSARPLLTAAIASVDSVELGSSDGRVTVRGTLTCSAPGVAAARGRLTQGDVAFELVGDPVPCGPRRSRWAARSQLRPTFEPRPGAGPAVLDLVVAARDSTDWARATRRASVVVVGPG